jgi:hypothetical protein
MLRFVTTPDQQRTAPQRAAPRDALKMQEPG